uniref:type II toxin-antitoxin system HicB family antitoxin n=1 Tax=uncultured Caulobacter sp. TaxID=158749 RepID=UPI0025EA1196|nr:type II toxin-antitoxin system HicB family antitoxin [uncultured Caulobacter sp.]
MPENGYSIVVRPLDAEDGGGFLATVPDLPGCMSDGDTEAEALENVRSAIQDWMVHARAEGRSIPPPKTCSRYGA